MSKEIQLKKAQEYAKSRGGECLSTEYKNNRTHMAWQCSISGHPKWESTYQNTVVNKRWCPKCDGKLSPFEYLEKAKEHAKNKGGECLSTEYKNAKNKMLWQCSNKQHKIWSADYNCVVHNNTWCPECAGNINLPEKSLKRAQDYAKSKGGKCLSKEYENAYTKLVWKCSILKHKSWETKLSHVLGGSWCPECNNENISLRQRLSDGLERAQKLANDRGGLCLSTEYITAHTKMSWKCSSKDHPIWQSSYKSILDGSWCPKCADFIYYKESKVRNILNYLLDTNFIKSTPIWNINPKTKRLLELDGYSEQLCMAFEFQGLHHYQKVFKSSDEKLEYIKYKDNLKKENCIKNNVKLLIIDDGKHCDNNRDLLSYILEILKNKNIVISKNIDSEEINNVLNKMTNFQEEALKKARDYAQSRGGSCLSTSYTNVKDKLEWKCEDDSHPSFFANMRVVYRKSWCKRCSTKNQWENNPPIK